MNANAVLLQKKYARVVETFSQKANISLDTALATFYHSELYQMMREGISDLHCMSEEYLAEELMEENQKAK